MGDLERRVRRLACLIAFGLAVAGCGSTFKDAKEELSYLESLSNPTADQWKRREALRDTLGERPALPMNSEESARFTAHVEAAAGFGRDEDYRAALAELEAAMRMAKAKRNTPLMESIAVERDRVKALIRP